MRSPRCKRSCQLSWDDLGVEPMTERVRHCSQCDHPIFEVRTDAEYSLHTGLGHCIALHEAYAKPANNIRIGLFVEPEWYPPRHRAQISAGLAERPSPRQSQGFRLFFGAWGDFPSLLERFERGAPVVLEGLSTEELEALTAELAAFDLGVESERLGD